MTFSEIPQLTSPGSYEINVPLMCLVEKITEWEEEGLQLNPEFQRGHVWSPAQQSEYLEYFLQGGQSGMVLYFNKPGWSRVAPPAGSYDEFVCVDGLQRLTALLGFLQNTIPAFGQLYHEFGQPIQKARTGNALRFNVNDLATYDQVLTWYLQMNGGGTPHSAAELARVAALRASLPAK